MSITVRVHGDFNNTERFLKRASKNDIEAVLRAYGELGVTALRVATPLDSGETSESWDYEIEVSRNKKAIYWTNSHVNNDVRIAVILQYGHGTRNGGYVQGRDYINPAMAAVFDVIADAAWKEVIEG